MIFGKPLKKKIGWIYFQLLMCALGRKKHFVLAFWLFARIHSSRHLTGFPRPPHRFISDTLMYVTLCRMLTDNTGFGLEHRTQNCLKAHCHTPLRSTGSRLGYSGPVRTWYYRQSRSRMNSQNVKPFTLGITNASPVTAWERILYVTFVWGRLSRTFIIPFSSTHVRSTWIEEGFWLNVHCDITWSVSA